MEEKYTMLVLDSHSHKYDVTKEQYQDFVRQLNDSKQFIVVQDMCAHFVGDIKFVKLLSKD